MSSKYLAQGRRESEALSPKARSARTGQDHEVCAQKGRSRDGGPIGGSRRSVRAYYWPMPEDGPNMSFTPYERPVRAAFLGLGRIYDLNVRAYFDNPMSKSSRLSIRVRTVAPSARRTGRPHGPSPLRPNWRPVVSR